MRYDFIVSVNNLKVKGFTEGSLFEAIGNAHAETAHLVKEIHRESTHADIDLAIDILRKGYVKYEYRSSGTSVVLPKD